MFRLGNATFACGVRSARERSFEEASGETEVGRRLLAPEHAHCRRWCWRHRHAPGMQTEPQVEPATFAGVILPENGQFLLLCSLQLWQQLQLCRQTRARMQVILTHFTSVLRKHLTGNNMFLREVNGHLRRLAYYKRALSLRNSWQLL